MTNELAHKRQACELLSDAPFVRNFSKLDGCEIQALPSTLVIYSQLVLGLKCI